MHILFKLYELVRPDDAPQKEAVTISFSCMRNERRHIILIYLRLTKYAAPSALPMPYIYFALCH